MDKHRAMLKAIENYLSLLHCYHELEDCMEKPPYEEITQQLHELKAKYQELYGVEPCSRCRV